MKRLLKRGKNQMRKIIIAGFFLWIQFSCVAADEQLKEEASVSLPTVCNLSKSEIAKLPETHNSEFLLETGETVFYPKPYQNYESYRTECLQKEEYTIKMLLERLENLGEFIKFRQSSEKLKYIGYWEDKIKVNELALKQNSPPEVLGNIFDAPYLKDSDYFKDNTALGSHLFDIRNFLKTKLKAGDERNILVSKLIRNILYALTFQASEFVNCRYDSAKDIFYECGLQQVAVAQFEEALESRPLEKEEIQGADYAFNCFLKLHYSTNAGYVPGIASGILIAPNLILTAAHNLYNFEYKKYPFMIDCFAARHESLCRAQATIMLEDNMSQIFIHTAYLKDIEQNGNDKYIPSDIGLIILREEILGKGVLDKFKSIRPAVPCELLEGTLRDIIDKKRLTITGYPGIRIPHSMKRKLIGYEGTVVYYDMPTKRGHSGSGICLKNSNDPRNNFCIGIHAFGGTLEKNMGVLIDKVISEKIREETQIYLIKT